MSLTDDQYRKIGDYLVDVSKYALTTTVIGTFFAGSLLSWEMYFCAMLFNLFFLVAGLYIIGIPQNNLKSKNSHKNNNPKQIN